MSLYLKIIYSYDFQILDIYPSLADASFSYFTLISEMFNGIVLDIFSTEACKVYVKMDFICLYES